MKQTLLSKNTLRSLFWCFTLLLLLPGKGWGQTTSIPDANFEQALITKGYDDVIDGKVITANISGILALDISKLSTSLVSTRIQDLTGIQDFTALQDLRCSFNSLTSLNVSALTNLNTLYCDNNSLTALDVHLLSNLTYLVCEFNDITDLNVSGLTNLYNIQSQANRLSTLDVSDIHGLIYLDVNDNKLTSLIVPTGATLTDLYCSNNSLTSLDLSGLTNLDFFEAESNLLLSCVIVDNETLVRPTFDIVINDFNIPEWTVDDRTVFGYNTVILADITEQYSSTPIALMTNIKCAKNITGTTTTTFPITNSTVVTWTFDGGSGNTITANQNVIITGTRWDGTSWSNTTGPTASIEAIIEGVYSTTTNGVFTAKKLTVNSGSLTINSGTNLTVENELINNLTAADVVIENNANLIQVNAVANTGAITVNRNSAPIIRLDHTLWSSPVSVGETLIGFSPSTLTNRFYNYDTATDKYVATPSTGTFTPAKGIAVRAPNDYTSTPTVFSGVFTGVPNNGIIPFTLETTGTGYNLVGNPYPSTIDASDFVAGNSTIGGTLYFYAHTLAMNSGGTFPAGTNYAVWTSGSGGVAATSGTETPNGFIQTGQGFFIKATSAGNVNFTNAMRSGNNVNQFFKTTATKTIERHRIWLNLTNETGTEFNQILVAYATGATQGIDRDYDGLSFGNTGSALSSKIAGEDYTIQGRALPFSPDDVVTLGFKAAADGNYTISLSTVDGLFAAGQDIYLKDAKTGFEQNLKTGSYTFTSAIGTFDSRFQLIYKTSASLGINDSVLDANSILIFKQNGLLNVNAGKIVVKTLRVFDIRGMLIFEQKGVNASTTTLKNFAEAKQTILIQITSEDNKTVIKKAIY